MGITKVLWDNKMYIVGICEELTEMMNERASKNACHIIIFKRCQLLLIVLISDIYE